MALSLPWLLAACGGGAGTGAADGEATVDATTTSTARPLEARAAAAVVPVGSICASGGARIDSGIDSNGNGVLDASEITNTQYVCQGSVGATGATGAAGAKGATGATGATGAQGAAGAAGRNGNNGSASLIRLDVEPAGSHCAAGGTKVSAGLDSNGNGVLDSSEVVNAPSYVCGATPGGTVPAGATGATGPTGAAGAPGTAGATGAAGANGTSSLMAMVAEAAGANCPYGGTHITTGLDSNGNGVLDGSEVTANRYSCNGAPGAGVAWVHVGGTAQQAQPGVGYLADNTEQVVITLPSAPVVGDLIQVSGVGAGGWRLAQNAAQTIVTRALPATYSNYGATWTGQAGAGSHAWTSIATSADGKKLLAAASGGSLATSADSGLTWTVPATAPVAAAWASVASSGDGSKLVAVVDGNAIYTSTDSGANWTAQTGAPGLNWSSVASSVDGSRLVAVSRTGYIFTSDDFGVTWAGRLGATTWVAVASSSDGSKLVAVDNASGGGGDVYTSTDFGVTWIPRSHVGNWAAVASSADGNTLVAVESSGKIHVSTDAGANWTARDSNRAWTAVAMSSDGRMMVAAVLAGKIFVSTDAGATWTARDSNRNWSAATASADGSRLAAVESNGLIYTSQNDRTTAGTTGSLSGAQFDSLELQYLGNGLFLPIDFTSYSGSFTVQ